MIDKAVKTEELAKDIVKYAQKNPLDGCYIKELSEALIADGWVKPALDDAERREQIKQEIIEAWNEPKPAGAITNRDTFGMFLDRAAERLFRLQTPEPVNLVCDKCGESFHEFGGLLFSPPDKNIAIPFL